jgi:type VI secretion system protein VasD
MRNWLGIAAFIGLAGCGGPPPPPPTIVNVTLNATADDNPTADNHGAPLSVRIYQLASAANFSGAEFFPLYNDDAGTLKSDLVRREDFILAPGASKSDTIMPTDQVKSIGVFGGYRDFQHSDWRGTADIMPHRTTNITITAGHDGITVKAETLPAKSGS